MAKEKIKILDDINQGTLYIEVTDLIRKILKFDPFDRLTMNQIIQHPWSNSSTVCTYQKRSLDQSKSMSNQHEQSIFNLLLEAGFDSTVVKDMRSNHFGMRGTLWQMLLKSHNPQVLIPNTADIDEPTQQSDDWIGTLKSWFNHKPWSSAVSSVTGAVQQHKFMMKTMAPIPSVIHQDLGNEIKSSFYDSPPPTKENDELVSCSTCSSTTDAEYDDETSSTTSSPATSITDDDDDDDDEKKSMSDLDNPVYPTVFHRVSPMVTNNQMGF